MRRHLRPADGPDAGKPLRLERWQSLLLDAIDREGKPIVACRMASQVGKSMLAVGVGLRAALDGRGCLMASATDTSIRDLARRLQAAVDSSPDIGRAFPQPTSGPGSRGLSWKNRTTDTGGWLGLAAAGSASQLASRTAAVAVADEIARWPARVKFSTEGSPLALLRARLFDWGDEGRLLAISSPVLRFDAIDTLFRDGDRRRLEYPCSCGDWTPFEWDQVRGRERGETPEIACAKCGTLHGEAERRRMLRRARWVPQRAEPTDEDVISFAAGRLDSARSSLDQVCREWRRARRNVERGERDALKTFRNVVLGLPGESGAADVDKLYEGRGRRFEGALEQVTAGVDVQADRLVFVVLGFAAANAQAVVLDVGDVLGDPHDDEPWAVLDSRLRQHRGLPVSVVSVDAGFLTSEVRRQCGKRRWWVPTVGRAGEGKPIAKRIGSSGIAVLGKDDASAWWAARVQAGDVYLPATISRPEIGELCAAEALTVDGGKLSWKPIEGRANHRWDAALLAVHGRHFAPRTAARRPFRLVKV